MWFVISSFIQIIIIFLFITKLTLDISHFFEVYTLYNPQVLEEAMKLSSHKFLMGSKHRIFPPNFVGDNIYYLHIVQYTIELMCKITLKLV